MNIFESIERTTRRIEPFHSRFLADALQDSIEGDRSLFDAVWRLTTPGGWAVPEKPKIEAEVELPAMCEAADMSGRGRIDILIHDLVERRIVGIEVKTTDSSATPKQLDRYYRGLVQKFGDSCAVDVAYLTPFNRQWAPDKADALPTVKAFDEFVKIHRVARHVSWLDIAAIPWNGNELWRQHQLYVYQHVSSHKKLRVSATRDRSLDKFFGEEPVAAFWEALSDLGIESQSGADTDINLDDFGHEPDFAHKLAQSFEILIMEGDTDRRKENEFSEEKRGRFLDSPHRKVHEALFALADRHSHVWVKGEKDYGIRVRHRSHTSGVSLVRSDGPERLKIVDQR